MQVKYRGVKSLVLIAGAIKRCTLFVNESVEVEGDDAGDDDDDAGDDDDDDAGDDGAIRE